MIVPIALAVGLGLLLAALVLVPRTLVGRSLDRLAKERIARLEGDGRRLRLLTRGELVTGRYRRIPGILGLTEEGVSFDGIFGESRTLAGSAIDKIVTGSRLASGRSLFRLEVLRITTSGGEELEFVLTRASAGAWRSHLGLWAMAERRSALDRADRVAPGR